MDRIIALAAKDRCTGCGACGEICPKGAISFQPDAEGFPFPVILKEKCIRCGACERACPALNTPETQSVREAYAAQINDRDVLMESTSGGVFSALSSAVFRLGGTVYGCVWDPEYNAVISRAENGEQIAPMHGSKYVWSRAGDSYPKVKSDLEEGRTVLFSGLPCQVAGLRGYLGKEYEQLYTLDCLCSGAPSPLALKAYLRTVVPSGNYDDLNLKFRDKIPYGVGVHITHKGKRAKRRAEHITNPYYYSFYSRMIDRESCYSCPYGTDSRISDLTMGDYWGVSRFHPEMNVRDGISALLINTEKGRELFDAIQADVTVVPTLAENIAKENNLSIGKVKPFRRPKNRDRFLAAIAADGWKKAERKYLFNRNRFKSWLKAVMPGRIVRMGKRLIKN